MNEKYEDWLFKECDRLSLQNIKVEEEYKELKEKYDRLDMLVGQLLFDKGAFPFICGIMGESDKNGMYDYFRICPAYGSDATYTYKKVT